MDEYLATVKDNDDNLWFVTYRMAFGNDGSIINQYLVKDNSKVITLFCIYKDNHGDLGLVHRKMEHLNWLGSFEKVCKMNSDNNPIF
ncbi:MAG: hypothetical protein R2784_20220 [Saprospiraceae bacterium]